MNTPVDYNLDDLLRELTGASEVSAPESVIKSKQGKGSIEAIVASGRNYVTREELGQLADFCAVSLVAKPDGRTDKIPKNPKTGNNARSNKPKTFGTEKEARQYLATSNNAQAVGVRLGRISDGYSLVALDHDGSLNPETGKIREITRDVMQLVPGRHEVSVSGRGHKSYAIVEGSVKTRSWSQGTGTEIKLMGENTYSVITDNLTDELGNTPEFVKAFSGGNIPIISEEEWADKLEALQVIGEGYKSAGHVPLKTEKLDVDRSKLAIGLAGKCKVVGSSYGKFLERVQNDGGELGKWYREKGCKPGFHNGEYVQNREVLRAWDNCNVSEPELALEDLDSRDDVVAAASNLVGSGDIVNAQRFKDYYDGNVLYINEMGNWKHFDGFRWVLTDGRLLIIEFASKQQLDLALRSVQTPNKQTEFEEKEARKLFTNKNVQDRALDRAEALLARPVSDFDADSYLLAVENGVLDLRSGRLIEPRADQYITRQAGAAFDPKATAPKWGSFLTQVLPDEEVRELFQTLIGLALIGSADEEVIVFTYGEARTGKSTANNVLDPLFGDYGKALSKELLIKSTSSEGDRMLAQLPGVRYATVNETSQGDIFDDHKVKVVASSEAISARALYKEPFEFQPSHTLFIRGNHMPGVQDAGDGFWRRMIPIEFPNQITKEDVVIGLHRQIIEEELSGVLNWALEGLIRYQKEGLVIPEAIEKLRDQYRRDTDLFGQFLEEHCVVDPSAVTLHSDLFKDYQLWASAAGLCAGHTRSFGNQLRQRGYKQAPGRKNGRKWTGIRLKARFSLEEAFSDAEED